MKKILFLVVCLFMATTSVATITNTYDFAYEDLNKTIVFDESTTLAPEERQYIADSIAYGNIGSDEVSTYAWCWLTGHDIVSNAVGEIQHKVSPNAPRCYETTYLVETCTKCDYMEATPVSSIYIDCCPED